MSPRVEPTGASDPRNSPRASRRRWLGLVAMLAVVIGLPVWALLIDDKGSLPHQGSAQACAHFRSVATQAFGGSLDAEEVQGVFAEIDRESAGATASVRTAARKMSDLSGNEDPPALLQASQEMATACAEAGH